MGQALFLGDFPQSNSNDWDPEKDIERLTQNFTL
jgi:hypothetical protein